MRDKGPEMGRWSRYLAAALAGETPTPPAGGDGRSRRAGKVGRYTARRSRFGL